MRFVFGPIPESRGLDAEASGWTPLREPDSRRFAFVAILLSVPFQVAAIWILFDSLEDFREGFKSLSLGFILFLAALLLMVPMHEFVHALAYLKGLRSRRLIMGIWPRRGMAYVIYDSPTRRNRLLFMVAAPFLVLSILPLASLPFLSSGARAEVLFLLVIHTAVCVGDAMVFWHVSRVPPNAWLHNKRWTTYWTVTGP